jgi:hypothetical protein
MANLGAAVSELKRVCEVSDVDEQIASYGDCEGLMWRGVRRDADRVAQKYGFKNVADLSDAVAERTSTRWVYFNFPCSAE